MGCREIACVEDKEKWKCLMVFWLKNWQKNQKGVLHKMKTSIFNKERYNDFFRSSLYNFWSFLFLFFNWGGGWWVCKFEVKFWLNGGD